MWAHWCCDVCGGERVTCSSLITPCWFRILNSYCQAYQKVPSPCWAFLPAHGIAFKFPVNCLGSVPLGTRPGVIGGPAAWDQLPELHQGCRKNAFRAAGLTKMSCLSEGRRLSFTSEGHALYSQLLFSSYNSLLYTHSTTNYFQLKKGYRSNSWGE